MGGAPQSTHAYISTPAHTHGQVVIYTEEYVTPEERLKRPAPIPGLQVHARTTTRTHTRTRTDARRRTHARSHQLYAHAKTHTNAHAHVHTCTFTRERRHARAHSARDPLGSAVRVARARAAAGRLW